MTSTYDKQPERSLSVADVRAERRAQGKPATITDPAALALIAAAARLKPAVADRRAA